MSEEQLATAAERTATVRDQRYNRIHGDELTTGVSRMISMSGDNGDVEIDITAGQKMLSAMSGSLLTSLLG